MISRQHSSYPLAMTPRVPAANVRLTVDEWGLIVAALSAYQHNKTYLPLYQKFAAQASVISQPWSLT